MKKEELFYIYNKVDGRIFRVGLSDYGAWSDLVCMTPGEPLSFAEMYEHDMECFKPRFLGYEGDEVPVQVVMEAAAAVMENPGLDNVERDLDQFCFDFRKAHLLPSKLPASITAFLSVGKDGDWTLEIRDNSRSYGWLFREEHFADEHSCRVWAGAYYESLLNLCVNVRMDFKKKCKDNGRTE